MVQPLNHLKESPSQTAGPYVHIGCTPNFAEISGVYPQDLGHEMITGEVSGQRIRISGRVFDGTGTPLRDAMIEIWQADAAGLFNSPVETRGTADRNFTGWGRCATDMSSGEFAFDTVKPGAVPYTAGELACYYVQEAGGITDDGWIGRLVIIRANGRVQASALHLEVRPGDAILVPSTYILRTIDKPSTLERILTVIGTFVTGYMIFK